MQLSGLISSPRHLLRGVEDDPLRSATGAVLDKLQNPHGDSGKAGAKSAATMSASPRASTSKFGDPANFRAAMQYLAEYNRTHNGNFDTFNFTQYALRFFKVAAILPSYQPRKLGNGSMVLPSFATAASSGVRSHEGSSGCSST
jgi:hypothetical protein